MLSSGAEVVTVNGWRKSSHSFANGNCAEVAAWRKSSRCSGGACAEVGQDGAVVGVRDSQDPDGAVLVFGPIAWVAFLAGLKSA
jgi:hypothetical protein